MLINDATFLLDESLDTLKAIHDTQVAIRDVASWNAQPQVLASYIAYEILLIAKSHEAQ